ncbi:hypothetical protein SORBI_3009G092800 [Sorghum bicolor]|uniref:Uncharacterized protein n=1 Tax=Sorghum bicolor TaxID=4558 RepID=C5YVQ4_SORBI|nr:hypothetical protein SORBI_3009G092800 [Sorghum bicolor]OQU77715.1 hypothetical protein SORBI_3009G092800 [Sorghum bicolor]OQU77716.1 hypothetical protein SORBI_3009G092800 [Sorghum bicolor]OQU77717.1 hypothetical protein SORBI_3009G092800 [Sorghum bicolor]
MSSCLRPPLARCGGALPLPRSPAPFPPSTPLPSSKPLELPILIHPRASPSGCVRAGASRGVFCYGRHQDCQAAADSCAPY